MHITNFLFTKIIVNYMKKKLLKKKTKKQNKQTDKQNQNKTHTQS